MDDRKTELLKKIGEQAVQQFWQEAFGGKSYGSQHLYRVNRIARYLWERDGVETAIGNSTPEAGWAGAPG